MKNIALLLLISIGFTACKPMIQEVPPDKIPQTSWKVVVHCFISPEDTVLAAIVGTSRQVLGIEAGYPISAPLTRPDARVVISNGVQSKVIPFDPASSQHRLRAVEFPIEAGKTYTLEVTMPDGTSVTAQTTVPRPIPLQRIQVDSIINYVNGSYISRVPVVRGFWNDSVQENNYYRIEGKVNYSYLSTSVAGGVPRDTTFTTSRYLSFDNTPYYSDRADAGKEMSSTIARLGDIARKPTQSSRTGRVGPVKISLSLLHLDEAFFGYQNIVRGWNTDNPFAEPLLIPTNIKGGLGCFGSYSVSKLSIDYD